MKRVLFPILLAALTLISSSCSDAPPPPGGNDPGESAAVGILKSNDYELLLHSTPDGSRYSLRDEKGDIIARELTREELAEAFPEIHEELQSLWAGNEGANPVEISPANPSPKTEAKLFEKVMPAPE